MHNLSTETATTITSIGTLLSGIATLIVAFANIVYARATARSAKVASDAVTSQASTAAQQIEAASKAAAKQTLATVVSAARLTWIDALRDDISEFLAINDARPSAQEGASTMFAMRPSEVSELVRRMSMLRNRIGFRLDFKKSHHRELFAALEAVLAAVPGDIEAGHFARGKAQAMFDREWTRAREEAAGREPATSPTQSDPIEPSR